MHGLRLFAPAFLDLVTLVSDDEVCVKPHQIVGDDPGRLIIDHDHLEPVRGHVLQHLFLLRTCSFKDRQCIWEVGKSGKLLFPDT